MQTHERVIPLYGILTACAVEAPLRGPPWATDFAKILQALDPIHES